MTGRPRLDAALLIAALAVTGCAGPAGSGLASESPSATSPSPAASTTPSATATAAPSSSEGAISGSFDIGGRSMVISCRGTGSPSLIFMVGTDWPSHQMVTIEDRFVDQVRVCHYDRAGEGDSDPPPAPATVETVVEDLAALLEAAAVPPPYILIGQSVGGDQAWLFADRHPDDVAGVLMMNAGFFELDWTKLEDVLTDAEIAGEREVSERGHGSVLQAATPPDDVPFTVLMSTDAQCETSGDVCHRIYPYFEAWAQELAARTPNGRIVSVAASHEIWPTAPDNVDAEIQRLIDLAR